MEKPQKRMTMMIEAALKNTLGDIDTLGFIEGTVRVGQMVYVMNPACTQEAIVSALEDISGVSCNEITDQRGHVFLKNAHVIQGAAAQAGFSFGVVIAETKPCIDTDCRKIENPYLSGLMGELKRERTEQAWANLLGFCLCNSVFVVPVVAQSGPKHCEGPIDISDDSLGLYWAQLPGKNPELPVFTDWAALERDTHIMESGEQPEARLARLGELLQIIRKFGPDTGIVVNPFGPSTFSMERALLENIAQTPGFKETFGDLGGFNPADYEDNDTPTAEASIDDNQQPSTEPNETSNKLDPSVSQPDANQPAANIEEQLSPEEIARQQAEKEKKLWELLTSED
ncbi:MAG: SseB family protein [Prevotella sp.]|nr:SseB family protein [Prevotella sp.]